MTTKVINYIFVTEVNQAVFLLHSCHNCYFLFHTNYKHNLKNLKQDEFCAFYIRRDDVKPPQRNPGKELVYECELI